MDQSLLDQKETLITAKDILKEGGNAFDAGIGAVFTSMVSEFALTGAGGGGILMGMEKDQSPMVYDFLLIAQLKKILKLILKKSVLILGIPLKIFISVKAQQQFQGILKVFLVSIKIRGSFHWKLFSNQR